MPLSSAGFNLVAMPFFVRDPSNQVFVSCQICNDSLDYSPLYPYKFIVIVILKHCFPSLLGDRDQKPAMTYVDPHSVIAIGILFPIVGALAFITRFHARRAKKTSFGLDDWLCLPALVRSASLLGRRAFLNVIRYQL